MTEKTFKSFAELGASLGIEPPLPAEEVERRRFRNLPVAAKLTKALEARNKRDHNANEFTSQTLRQVLAMKDKARAEHGIKIIAMIPEGAELPFQDELVNYPVLTAFPNVNGQIYFISETRVSLAGQVYELSLGAKPTLEALQLIDEQVKRCAELRPELPHERYNRIVSKVKLNDGKIALEKKDAELHHNWSQWNQVKRGVFAQPNAAKQDILNGAKHQILLDYLREAADLHALYPDLGPLYTVGPGKLLTHVTLEMFMTRDVKLRRRVVDSAVEPNLFRGISFSTSIKRKPIQDGRKRFEGGSDTSDDKITAELAILLDGVIHN